MCNWCGYNTASELMQYAPGGSLYHDYCWKNMVKDNARLRQEVLDKSDN